LGFEPPIVRAQVKSTTSSIGDSDVKHLFASINAGEFGLFVTLGGFSKPAEEFARSKANLSLITGKRLAELVMEHYSTLNPSSKAIVPLRQSLVPDVTSGDV
jgi:restriction system protein